MISRTWQLQDAKNRFSEVVTRALNEGAQTVTKHGKPAVIVHYDENSDESCDAMHEKYTAGTYSSLPYSFICSRDGRYRHYNVPD